MSILTTTTSRVIRSFARTLALVRELRRTPKAPGRFGAGMPEADSIEIGRVDRNTMGVGLRADLRDRAAAPPLATVVVAEEPCSDHNDAARVTAPPDMFEAERVVRQGGNVMAVIGRDEKGLPHVIRLDEYPEGNDESPALPAGADEHMDEDELAILEELNAINPVGAIEADLDAFPAFAGWPDWTSRFFWGATPTGDPEPRLILAELVDLEARRLRGYGNAAGDLMAGSLEELARVVRVVGADHPVYVGARLEALERDFSGPIGELEPELTASGRYL